VNEGRNHDGMRQRNQQKVTASRNGREGSDNVAKRKKLKAKQNVNPRLADENV